jgi:hypothetical protein
MSENNISALLLGLDNEPAQEQTYADTDFSCQIDKDKIGVFRACLDSVRFPKGTAKNTYTDVLIQITTSGVTFQSVDVKGVISTRTLLKKDFFDKYRFSL